MMKRILRSMTYAAVLILCIAAATITAMADEPAAISSADDLKRLCESGGEGILTKEIDAREVDLDIPSGKTVTLDMGRYAIHMRNYDVNLDGNLILKGDHSCWAPSKIYFSGDIDRAAIKVRGDIISDYVDIVGDDVTVSGHSSIYMNGADFKCKISHVKGRVIVLKAGIREYGDSRIIQSDEFMQMVEEQEFVDITSPGVTLYKWKEWNGDYVTEWAKEGQHMYVAEWKAEGVSDEEMEALTGETEVQYATASTFSEGNIWKILSFVFAITTVIAGLLAFRKK